MNSAAMEIGIPQGVGLGVSLRAELALRGMRWAARRGLVCERTDGGVPGVVFARGEDGGHGNFHPQAYAAIGARPEWARRLGKVHTASRRVRARADWRWMELDCAASSDALLMNVFCFPGVMESVGVRALLGVSAGAAPEFGVKPRTPLKQGKRDATEVDMRVGELLVEAKLTESDFQSAPMRMVERYRDFDEVFEAEELPMRAGVPGQHRGPQRVDSLGWELAGGGNGRVLGYQLIRGTLAAHASGGSFCVLCDARRPELVEMWYRVMRAVRPFDLRSRLKLLTWQELASVVPGELAKFLAEKYGIVAAG